MERVTKRKEMAGSGSARCSDNHGRSIPPARHPQDSDIEEQLKPRQSWQHDSDRSGCSRTPPYHRTSFGTIVSNNHEHGMYERVTRTPVNTDGEEEDDKKYSKDVITGAVPPAGGENEDDLPAMGQDAGRDSAPPFSTVARGTSTCVVATPVQPIEFLSPLAVTPIHRSSSFKSGNDAEPQQKRRMLVITALIVSIVLLIAAAIGIAVGIASKKDKKSTSTTIQSPTFDPQALRTVLTNVSKNALLFDDPSTPQSKALQWLENTVDRRLPISEILTEEMKKRYVVALLYFATNGHNWAQSLNFLLPGSICDWHVGIVDNNSAGNDGYGVFCHDSTMDPSVISLAGNRLKGSIPTELFYLSRLEKLHLENNELTGAIPTEVGRLSLLNHLDIEQNKLTGQIPTELGNLMSLESLHASANFFTGQLPSETGRLISMRKFEIVHTLLAGPIPPELGRMTRLEFLSLEANLLTGSIPIEFFNLVELDTLILGDNELTGHLPTELGHLRELGTLNIFSNELTGPIPTEIGQLTMLELLHADDNWFTGKLPSELGLLTLLRELMIAHSNLTGQLPSELGLLTLLRTLNLAQNALTGPIPTELGLLNITSNLNGNSFDD